MAPPRIQCVNSLRTVSRQAPGLRAAFSTSQIIRAEDDSEPPKRSSPNDFLSSLSSPVQPASIPRAPRFERSSLSSPSPSPIPRNNSTGAGRAAAIIDRSFADRKRAARENPSSSPPGSPAPGGYGSVTAADLEQHKKTVGLGRQLTRKFKAGDVYAPHDLSSIEMEKYRKRQRPHLDCFDVLGLNPLDHYRNFSMISEYMTPMGRIKHANDTGLRPVNQRRIARAIRRMIGMGMMPSVHRHPEIIQKQLQGELQAPRRLPM